LELEDYRRGGAREELEPGGSVEYRGSGSRRGIEWTVTAAGARGNVEKRQEFASVTGRGSLNWLAFSTGGCSSKMQKQSPDWQKSESVFACE
jgi:hypothetical protein